MRMKTTILYAIVINPVIGYCDSNLPFSIGLKKDTDQARIFFRMQMQYRFAVIFSPPSRTSNQFLPACIHVAFLYVLRGVHRGEDGGVVQYWAQYVGRFDLGHLV